MSIPYLKQLAERATGTPLVWRPGDGPITMCYKLNYPTPTDEQIDALISDILDYTAQPDDTQRAAVREWLANL
jgi:hypothetical protein